MLLQDLVGSIDSGTFRDAQQQAAQQEQQQAQRMASGAFDPPPQRGSPEGDVPTGVSMVFIFLDH